MTAKPLAITEAPSGPHLHVPFLERASEGSGEERSRGLGAFLTLRLVDRIAGDPKELGSTALRYQLNACANYLRDLYPEANEVSHLREIVKVAKQVNAKRRRHLLWSPLLAFAHWLESELRLDESIDVLETALRLRDGSNSADDVAAYLQEGRVLRSAGRFDDSRAAYVAAGHLAAQRGDWRSAMVSRIGCAGVAQKTGDLPRADRELREVLACAQERGDMFIEARACHDLAVNKYHIGRAGEAVPLAFRAFQLYEEPAQRIRALNDTGVFLKEIGHYAAAREAFQRVLDTEVAPEMRLHALQELMELTALVSDRVGFERWRRELQIQYKRMPPWEQVDFQMKLGNSLACFGRASEAIERLELAVALAETYKLGQRVFDAERLLDETRAGKAKPDLASPTVPDTEDSPELQSAINGVLALRGAR